MQRLWGGCWSVQALTQAGHDSTVMLPNNTTPTPTTAHLHGGCLAVPDEQHRPCSQQHLGRCLRDLEGTCQLHQQLEAGERLKAQAVLLYAAQAQLLRQARSCEPCMMLHTHTNDNDDSRMLASHCWRVASHRSAVVLKQQHTFLLVLMRQPLQLLSARGWSRLLLFACGQLLLVLLLLVLLCSNTTYAEWRVLLLLTMLLLVLLLVVRGEAHKRRGHGGAWLLLLCWCGRGWCWWWWWW